VLFGDLFCVPLPGVAMSSEAKLMRRRPIVTSCHHFLEQTGHFALSVVGLTISSATCLYFVFNLRIPAARGRECIYVLQMFFFRFFLLFPSATIVHKYETTVLGNG